MSYEVVYAVEDGEPIDGDLIASTKGWAEFGDWGVNLDRGDYPEIRYICYYGSCHPGEAVLAIGRELTAVLKKRPNRPSKSVLGVVLRLLSVVKKRPKNCDGFVITSGEVPGGEEETDLAGQ
jgi:hypothetical protein